MASTKIVAKYAKSNRSSCKKCTNPISANTLRLGLVSRDSRGFDMTKWHHLNCFPTDSQQIDSVEKIDGFSSLKSSDQEALMKLAAECDQFPLEVRKADEAAMDQLEESNSKKPKVSKADESAVGDLEENDSKKLKSNDQEALKKMIAGYDRLPKEVCDGEEEKGLEGNNRKVRKANEAAPDELEKSDSKKTKVSKADEAAVDELEESKSNKLKIVAEYAKSNRSSCKKCTNAISAKSLRLGLVIRERGFDMTKWHHLNCFPTESLLIVSVEKIDGFLSLKSSDQE